MDGNPDGQCYECGVDDRERELIEKLRDDVEGKNDVEITRAITAIWETFDHASFNQQSVAVAFGKAVLSLRSLKSE